ncbi:MAG: hypothetical protein Aurels2KO_34040 [Aureliella sp.]
MITNPTPVSPARILTIRGNADLLIFAASTLGFGVLPTVERFWKVQISKRTVSSSERTAIAIRTIPVQSNQPCFLGAGAASAVNT